MNANRGSNNPNRTSAPQYRPPQNPQNRLQSMTPADQQRLAQREEQFRRLPAQKQQDMRRAADQWSRMTPQQREHIQNDILPKWKQMPPQRQKAIQNRLGVLQNMPEEARNRHLNDPNFTRGMSEEDKDMLRDLAHQHVGGAPQPPNE